MPRTITEMPKPAPRGNRKYPWDEIFADRGVGDKVAFDKGTDEQVEAGEADFSCLATSFAVQVRSEASNRGFSLHIPDIDKDSKVVSVELRAPKADEADEAEASDEDTDTDES